MKKIIFLLAVITAFCLNSYAGAVTTVYGSGGVVTYPEGHKAICPIQNTTVCAVIKEVGSSANGYWEVGDAIEVYIDSELEDSGEVEEILGDPGTGGELYFR